MVYVRILFCPSHLRFRKDKGLRIVEKNSVYITPYDRVMTGNSLTVLVQIRHTGRPTSIRCDIQV